MVIPPSLLVAVWPHGFEPEFLTSRNFSSFSLQISQISQLFHGTKSVIVDTILPQRHMRAQNREILPQERTFTIGEVARMLGVSEPTLRLYEREGLILPFRKPSGHRLFTHRDIERLECIRRGITEEKIGIEGMKRILALIPCWRLRGCPSSERVKCSAFEQYHVPCWMLPEKAWECRDADCRGCHVYLHAADCSSLKTLIVHLTTSNP
jgi:MerR family transcriptional regulator/heat shock protein HspR